MRFRVKYHNKPHSLKLSNIHIVPMAKGVWHLICELNLRGYDVICTGGTSSNNWKKCNHSIDFRDDKDIRAELTMYPDTPEEAHVMHFGQIYKHTYYAVLISDKVYCKQWDTYCKNKRNKK